METALDEFARIVGALLAKRWIAKWKSEQLTNPEKGECPTCNGREPETASRIATPPDNRATSAQET